MQKQYGARFILGQPIGEVFPLFSPEGERLWVPEWKYQYVSEHKQVGEDAVFLTETHDQKTGSAVWLVKQFQPQHHRVQYYKVEANSKVTLVTVQCEALASHQTRVTVCYRYIGLNAERDAFIQQFSEADYRAYVQNWKTVLEAYFVK